MSQSVKSLKNSKASWDWVPKRISHCRSVQLFSDVNEERYLHQYATSLATVLVKRQYITDAFTQESYSVSEAESSECSLAPWTAHQYQNHRGDHPRQQSPPPAPPLLSHTVTVNIIYWLVTTWTQLILPQLQKFIPNSFPKLAARTNVNNLPDLIFSLLRQFFNMAKDFINNPSGLFEKLKNGLKRFVFYEVYILMAPTLKIPPD